MTTFKRYVKRTTRKRYGSRKKGYKYGKIVKDAAKVGSMLSIAKDIYTLKRQMNTEKKKYNLFIDDAYFGLTYTSGSTTDGYYASYISPNPTQGIQAGQRIGNSIKVVSAMFQAQITPQANANLDDLTFRWFIVNKPDCGTQTTPPNMMNQFLNTNPFSGRIDTFSNRDPEYYNAYRIVASGKGKIKMSDTASTNKVPSWNIKKPLKLSLHQKYNGNNSTQTTKNQLYLIFVADNGDCGAGDLTGLNLKWTCDFYYVDN